jgi:hypothetical protein
VAVPALQEAGGMIKLRQHIPAFVETDRAPLVIEAADTGALLAHPRIQSWAKDDPYVRDGVHGVHRFHQFSVADRRDSPALMAEYDEGDYFWVIGHITEGADALQLPDWRETETARIRREKWNRGITD